MKCPLFALRKLGKKLILQNVDLLDQERIQQMTVATKSRFSRFRKVNLGNIR